MKITKVELWNDTGFVDGAAEVPSMTDVLPTADVTITDELRPAKDELFSRLKISSVREQTEETTVFWAFEDLVNVSYVAIKYDRLDYTIYGWVDNVLMISDSPTPITAIDWHIDYWRTFISSAKFGYGLVQRRLSAVDPPQNPSYRFRKLSSSSTPLIPASFRGAGILWAIFTFTQQSEDSKLTSCHTGVSPVRPDGGAVYFQLGPSTTKVSGMTRDDWVNARFDEKLGIAPSSISSAFLSPVPPFKLFDGDGSSDSPFIFTGSESSSSEPVTTIRSGSVGQRYATAFSYGKDSIPTVTTPEGSQHGMSGVYAISPDATSSGLNLATLTLDGTQIGASSSSTKSWLGVAPLDDFVRFSFGSDVFAQLKTGDIISITNVAGVATAYSSMASYAILPGGSELITTAFTATGSTSVRTFTFANGSFGNYFVLLTADPSNSVVSLTTTASTVTVDDFALIQGTAAAVYRNSGKCDSFDLELSTTVMTDDTEEMIILDQTASPVASLPWGFEVKKYTVRNVLTSTSAYVEIRFDGTASASEGLKVSIPCPALDITSNSWSDYVYSGQRDYDITQKKIASQQALVGAVTGAMGSAFQTGVLGGLGNGGASQEQIAQLQQMMMKQYRGDKGASMISGIVGGGASTALRSGVGMLGMGLAGATVDYLTMRYFNGKLQSAEEMAKAKQLDTIQSPGGGWDFLWHGISICLTSLKIDEYSVDRFDDDLRLNGAKVSEPTSDCTSLVKAGGPLQIANLIVLGNIPVQAKNYIANKFANGVRIK